MRKLDQRERLWHWTQYPFDRHCVQCPHYLKFDREEQVQFDGWDGWCELSERAVYWDETCDERVCDNCEGNAACAVQVKTERFVDELELVYAPGTEFEDWPTFQSLLRQNIMRTIAMRCPHFKRKPKDGQSA